MPYSAIGFLALIILIISDHSILRYDRKIPAQKEYRAFLWSVMGFYFIDGLWGIFDSINFNPVSHTVTTLFFAVMTASVLLWMKYIIAYLEDKGLFGKFLLGTGNLYFSFELIALVVNLFIPIFFWFDDNGIYHAEGARYVTLLLQVLMFTLSSVYTLYITIRSKAVHRRRCLTICYFGIIMVIFIVFQVFFPLLPLYSIGYILGNRLLQTFVIEDEQEEYRKNLEIMLEREKQQKEELISAKKMILTDPLTGVKSKLAFSGAEEEIDSRISDGTAEAFAVGVFDINDLKHINDTLGHDTGDLYIKNACRLICSNFSHSPVFRIGGDEFAIILQGEEYLNRTALFEDFDSLIEDNIKAGMVAVASGVADFDPHFDKSFRTVFARADKNMYRCKHSIKSGRAVR